MVIIDFETSGLDFYNTQTFKVHSLATCEYVDGVYINRFFDTPQSIREELERLAKSETPLGVYNLGFEYGVTQCMYPDLSLNYQVDVARLVQTYGIRKGQVKSFSLKNAVRRILPQNWWGYEEEIKSWILTNVPAARSKDWGAYINQAPYEILKRYNEADVEATYRLYHTITNQYKRENYKWDSPDHLSYKYLVHEVTQAKIQGIKVDLERLKAYQPEVEKEIASIYEKFYNTHLSAILKVREMLKEKLQAKYKRKIVTELPEFNIGSKKHLEYLFCDVLDMRHTCRYWTPKLQPSFKSKHLKQWGDGGKMLVKLGNRKLVLNQVKALLTVGASGVWHPDLKLIGTTTGRLSGGT